MKIDRRRTYYIGLDTETLNGIMRGDKLDLTDSLVYDLGWDITDKHGNIYDTKSYVIADTFLDMSEEMKSAYYAEKIPQYWDDIKSGKRKLVTFATARKMLLADIENYKPRAIFAHNARFDYRALNNTIRYLTKSKMRYFFPYGTEIWDTLKMSKVITMQKTYKKFCESNDFMTNHKPPRPRATAEILYRYITKNLDFVESHTGLEDVLIETQIFAHCFRQHKKMDRKLFKDA